MIEPATPLKSMSSALDAVDFIDLARKAEAAVEALWDPEVKTFWRDTADQAAAHGDSDQVRPTVTCRCTEEILDAKVVSDGGIGAARVTVDGMAKAVVDADTEELLSSSDLNYPQFTLALMVATTAKVAVTAADLADSQECERAARAVLPQRVQRLLGETPGIRDCASIHPFVRFHTIRALEAARPLVKSTRKLQQAVDTLHASIHEDTRNLLAKHHLDTISPGESVALAFCAATLSKTGKAEDDKVALAALVAAIAAQDAGSWPLGRVVRDETSRLEVSTYEVAWAATVTLGRLLGRKATSIDDPDTVRVVEAIARAGTFAARAVVELDRGVCGWASDHPYQARRVESWTSAIVLQFALAAGELRDVIRNEMVLPTFNVAYPDDDSWPSWLRWASLSKSAEPDNKHPIYGYLQRSVIDVIERDPRRLPSGHRECASVLLFGPPGTSKTTIVQAVADALKWPVVLLSPGVFIAKGLEAIEAEAQSVFERLQALRRVVVIFDECDELFRDRNPSGNTEQVRNISAFVTASMLPKLQELHDKGQILFIICTNHVAMMDPAVKRGGRIDHRIGVGPPDSKARRRILLDDFKPSDVPFEEEALKQLATSADRFSRSELKRAAKVLRERGRGLGWSDADAAQDAATKVVEEMNPSLTITSELYDEFIEHRNQFSDPYHQAAQEA